MNIEIPTIKVVGKGNVTRKADVSFIVLYLRANGLLFEDARTDIEERTLKITQHFQKNFPEIEGIEVVDVFIGDHEKSSWKPREEDSRAEIIKGILVQAKPIPDKLLSIIDCGIRMKALTINPAGRSILKDYDGNLLYGLLNAQEAEEEAYKIAYQDGLDSAERFLNPIGKKSGKLLKIHSVELGQRKLDAFSYERGSFKKIIPTSHLSSQFDRISISCFISMEIEILE